MCMLVFGSLKLIEDRALRSVITVALLGKASERIADRGQCGNSTIYVRNMLQCQTLYIPAGPASVPVKRQQCLNVLKQWQMTRRST